MRLKDTLCTCTQNQPCQLFLGSLCNGLWERVAKSRLALQNERGGSLKGTSRMFIFLFPPPQNTHLESASVSRPRGASGGCRDRGEVMLGDAQMRVKRLCFPLNAGDPSPLQREFLGQCEPAPADERLPSCWVFGEITPTKPLQASAERLQPSPLRGTRRIVSPRVCNLCVWHH